MQFVFPPITAFLPHLQRFLVHNLTVFRTTLQTVAAIWHKNKSYMITNRNIFYKSSNSTTMPAPSCPKTIGTGRAYYRLLPRSNGTHRHSNLNHYFSFFGPDKSTCSILTADSFVRTWQALIKNYSGFDFHEMLPTQVNLVFKC